MKVQSLCYLNTLSEEDLARHECSDRIWVSHTIFTDYIANEPGIAAIVKLVNGVDQHIPAVIYGAHYDDPNTIYVPSWMLAELVWDEENVRLERFNPSLGTMITIVPHTSDHISNGADPETLLRDGFEQYTCLVKGLDYKIWLGTHSFNITLMDVHPVGQDVICIRGSPLELELLAPLDRPPTPPPPPPPPTPPTAEPQLTTPAQEEPSAEERRAVIAAATRRRLGMNI